MGLACIDSLAKRQYTPAARISFFDPTAKSVKSSRGLAGPTRPGRGAQGSDTVSLPAGQGTIPAYPCPTGDQVSNVRVRARTRGSPPGYGGSLLVRPLRMLLYTQPARQPHPARKRPAPNCSPLQAPTLRCVVVATWASRAFVLKPWTPPTHQTARHQAQEIVGTLIGTLTNRRHRVPLTMARFCDPQTERTMLVATSRSQQAAKCRCDRRRTDEQSPLTPSMSNNKHSLQCRFLRDLVLHCRTCNSSFVPSVKRDAFRRALTDLCRHLHPMSFNVSD
jgi:hypothetical protein